MQNYLGNLSHLKTMGSKFRKKHKIEFWSLGFL